MLQGKIRKWLLGRADKRMPMENPPLRVAGQGVQSDLDDCTVNVAIFSMAGLLVPVFLIIKESALKSRHRLGSGSFPKKNLGMAMM
jgi:hypothetical protein